MWGRPAGSGLRPSDPLGRHPATDFLTTGCSCVLEDFPGDHGGRDPAVLAVRREGTPARVAGQPVAAGGAVSVSHEIESGR